MPPFAPMLRMPKSTAISLQLDQLIGSRSAAATKNTSARPTRNGTPRCAKRKVPIFYAFRQPATRRQFGKKVAIIGGHHSGSKRSIQQRQEISGGIPKKGKGRR